MSEFKWPKEAYDYVHDLTGGWGEQDLLDYLGTFVDTALDETYERGYSHGYEIGYSYAEEAYGE